jgi:C_GCAxxG_C_C family probable redox protein
MDTHALVQARVHEYYWEHDWNCAVTTLRILAEVFNVTMSDQVLDAALGMHGAGGYRAQCGLVEGALMFVGMIGKAQRLTDDVIVEACFGFAKRFEERFGSLFCRELRPEGFKPENPPHLCEDLTCEAILFDITFVGNLLTREKQ